jgi:hypothetical protein
MAKTKAAKEEEKPTRDELIAELVERGFDEADLVDLEVSELEAQIKADDLEAGPEAPKASEEEEAEEDEETIESAPQAAPEPTVAAKGGKSVDIIKGGEYVRTYSLEDHGKDFMKLAEEFVTKDERYSIAKPGQVKEVIVSYRVENKKTGVFTPISESFTDRAQAIAFKNQQPGNVKVSMTFR